MVKDLTLEHFYRGKRVLVTGHSGFKGAWLVEWLKLMGAEISGYALAPEHPEDNLHVILKHHSQVRSQYSDIRDREQLTSFLKSTRPEVIFHMAAQPLVRESYANPIETFEVNVMGTLSLFESLRKLDFSPIVINVTTDKVYSTKKTPPEGLSEDDPLGGQDPYSASKACSEILGESYRYSFFQHSEILLAQARAGNVIGGGDFAKDRLIPDIFRAAREKKTLSIRSPNAVRPWQHVLVPLSGYLLLGLRLAENPEFARSWNFGPEAKDFVSVEKLVQSMKNLIGEHYEITPADHKLKETLILTLNSNQAIKELNWRHLLPLNQALETTERWYRSYLQGDLQHCCTEVTTLIQDFHEKFRVQKSET